MSVASRQPAWQVASARNRNRSYCRIISARSENHPSQGFSQANTGQGVRVFVCVLSAIYCDLLYTTISLCLDLFPWAKFRQAKGGVKAHVLLDHDDYLPSYVLITEAKTSDVRVAQSLHLNAGSIVAIDRGYTDYALFGKWTGGGGFFVTRLKDNAAYEGGESALGPLPRNILADEPIRFTGAQAATHCPHLLRRVVVWDEVNEREIVLLSNLLHFGPTTIAAIYKDRWEIELFFKALKQNLKVKSFVGTSLERATDSDLDGVDRHAAVEMAAPPLEGEMVLLESGLHAAFESVHLPGSAAVAGESLGIPPLVPLTEQLSLNLS